MGILTFVTPTYQFAHSFNGSIVDDATGVKLFISQDVASHVKEVNQRVCDGCQCMKVKCNGKQPCTHCTTYKYGKVFSLTSFRNPGSRLP